MNGYKAITIIAVLALSAGAGLLEAGPLYFTATNTNQIWVADTDGSAAPAVLFSNAGPGTQGPAGIDLDESGGTLFWGTGNSQQLWTGNADGSGAPSSVYTGLAEDQHDVTVDAANDRVFLTVRNTGVYVAPKDGSGPVALLYSGAAVTVAYNARDDLIYFGGPGMSDLMVGAADGSGANTLYTVGGGIQSTGVRDIALDVGNGKIYWVDNDDVWSANLDGSGAPSILFNGMGGNLRAMDIDPVAGKLYLGEFAGHSTPPDVIWAANADGSGTPTTLYSGDFGGLRGIAIEPTAPRPLYFTGTNTNKIWVADTHAIAAPVVLFSNAGPGNQGPAGIDLDQSAGNLFWGTGNHALLWTGNADGSGAPSSVYDAGGSEQHDVAVDTGNDRVFFTGQNTGVYVGPDDGSGPTTLLYAGSPVAVAYNARDDLIYFGGPKISDLMVGAADGSSQSVLFASIPGVRDIALDVMNGKIYWVDINNVWWANLDGSGTPSILFNGLGGRLRAIDIDPVAGKLYLGEFAGSFAPPDVIWTANADGSGTPRTLYSGDFGGLRGLAVEPTVPRPLYFTATDDNEIWVADTHGVAAPAVLFSNAGPGTEGPAGIDLDEPAGTLFWGTGNFGQLWTGNADGSGAPSFVYGGVGVEQHDVAVDAANGRVFFTGQNTGVYVAPRDGSGPVTQLYAGAAVTVAYNATNDLIYFGGPFMSDLMVGATDGSSQAVLFAATAGVRDIALDVGKGKIYWVDIINVWSANLDGSGTPSILFNGLGGRLRAIDIDAVAGKLYLGEFAGRRTPPDVIWTANADGSGTPTTLYSGDFGGLRGLVVELTPAPDIPPCWLCDTQCQGDFDCDGDVDTVDWPTFRDAWSTAYPEPDYNPCGDMDRDGDIDTVDWPGFRDHWQMDPLPGGCPLGGTWPPAP